MKKYLIKILMFVILIGKVYGFDEGFIWALKFNFNGSATLPSISKSDLEKVAGKGDGSSYMKGGVGYTMDGEAELGYLFGSERWFGMDRNRFSGMSFFGFIGVGSGYVGEIAGNTIEGVTVDMYINLNFAPVINFGIGTKAYFFNSKLAVGLAVGAKLVADLSPAYLAYTGSEEINDQIDKIGEIIVDSFMIKNMNPCMISAKLMLEYNQPVIDNRLEVVLGFYARFNVWSPKYITMPQSLLKLIKEGANPDFDPQTPLKSFYLNSFDFGISLGLAFRGSD